MKKYIMCDLCGSSFDSKDKQFCQPCEFYYEGLDKFGETKSNLGYQIEAGLESLAYMASQIKDFDSYE